MPIPDVNARAVLVTGGAGFIGSHLLDALRALGVGLERTAARYRDERAAA